VSLTKQERDAIIYILERDTGRVFRNHFACRRTHPLDVVLGALVRRGLVRAYPRVHEPEWTMYECTAAGAAAVERELPT